MLATGMLVASLPVRAEWSGTHAGGFASRQVAEVHADPMQVWDELVQPENWWPHTWSGSSANLRLEPVAGGCLCEVVPGPDATGPGSAEHARVVMAAPGRVLRMAGALGPLQAEGVAGVLTVTLAPIADGHTRIEWDYVVGGAARIDLAQFAPIVDAVQGEFLRALASRFEARQ